MAERQIGNRKSCLVLSARFPVVNWRSRPVAKSAYYYMAGSVSKRKIQDQSISSRSRVYRLYKSFSFTEKQPRKPETVIKDGFVEMKHEFPFEAFRSERQDYLFRCLLLVLSFAPRDFSPGTLVLSSPQTFPNSNSTTNQVDEEPICGYATSKSLFIYLLCSVASGNFPPEWPKKSCSIYFPTELSEKFL